MSAPSRAGVWIQAFRPQTLPVGCAPIALGTALAARYGGARVGPALAALAGALLLQIGTNLSNDAGDAARGADTPGRLGPTRAVAAGLLTSGAVKRAAAIAFLLATLCGAYLWWVAGPIVVAIGVASILAGLAYTTGPYPLAYHGLGEVFVIAFFGVVATAGTAFVQLGFVPTAAWPVGVASGCLASAVLVVNNLRDRETDRVAGKKTMAVRLGRQGSIAEYATLIGVGLFLPVATFLTGHGPVGLCAGLLVAPLAGVVTRKVATTDGAALNWLLGATARVMLVHAALTSGGLILWG